MASLVWLDTSALLTLRDDEPGADRVEALLELPQRCYACFLTRMEVLHPVWRDEGEPAGRLADEQLKAMPLHWIEASEPLLEQAASIKARYALFLAEAWIAAADQQIGVTLLHKDPEFRVTADLPQEWLG